jgi:folate-binding protein YgfZ
VTESPLRSTHASLGASFVEVAGVELPRSYGEGAAEYRAVREAAGVVDRRDQAQLRMWGREPVKMLHGLLTNDLLGAAPGQGVYAAMLTPKGRTIAELRAFTVVREGRTEVLIDLPREALAGTVEHLKKFVPPMFARWEVAESMGSLGVYGPRAGALLRRAVGVDVPELAEDAFVEVELEGRPVVAVGTRYAGGEPGYDLVADGAALPAIWDALLARGGEPGARPVGHAVLETLRIEAGRPRYGRDLTEEIIPTEAFESTGLMERAVSFGKGCYTGQEVIVRIAHRGHVNRHLRGLRLGDAATPTAGAPLFREDGSKEVGRVTSAAFSPLMGETVALGYLRREIGPGDRVRVGGAEGAEAIVAELPFRKEE